jgi:diguanylate cyclase (GGDEF)-like protein
MIIVTTELDVIMTGCQIQTLFQPIFDNVHRQVLGYEALSRGPSDSLLHSPLELFRQAELEGRQAELELLCVVLAMKQFVAQQLNGKLFVNISPSVLLTLGIAPLLDAAKQSSLSPALVVIELTENHPAASGDDIIGMVKTLKELGFMVAIDDLGAGNSGLRLWSELRPDFVKLDIYFAANIDNDNTKRQFVASLCDLASKLGCKMILEGVERKEEYQVARQIGIQYCQGYLFGKPAAIPTPFPADLLIDSDESRQTSAPLRDLVVHIPAISPDLNGMNALELFRKQPDASCFPVLDDQGLPLGILKRHTLLRHFAEQFGHSLYAKAPVAKLMDKPIIVDVNQSLLKVSQLLVEHDEEEELGTWFIICEEGKYLGLGRLRDLMRKLTQYKLTMARYANPLTLLHGNVPIQRAIEKNLQDKKTFLLAYCDLNDFKPYNDVCGYERGDMMIKLVARLLRQYFGQHHNFIGHLGGDDFILLLQQDEWIAPIKALQAEFRRQRLHYYRNEDIINNGIYGKDRDGNARKFPLVDLSVGIFPYTPDLSLTASQISSTLSTAKHRAKGTPGHLYCLDNQRFDFSNALEQTCKEPDYCSVTR